MFFRIKKGPLTQSPITVHWLTTERQQ